MKASVWVVGLCGAIAATACNRNGSEADAAAADTAAPTREAYDSLAPRRAAFEKQLTSACEAIYKEQANQFSNVVGWKYNNDLGRCFVEYRYDPPKSPAQCDSMYPPEDPNFVAERLLCHDGRYRTRF